jgi:hypothetical protein
MLTTLKNVLTRLLHPQSTRRYRVTPRHNPWVFRRCLLRAIRAELRRPCDQPGPRKSGWSANLEGTTLRQHRA